MAIVNMLKKLSIATAGASVIALGIAGTAQALTTIDTQASWNGSSDYQPFGEPDTATYGQTFTVGSDDRLNNFSFWLKDLGAGVATNFGAYIAEWDGVNNSITGAILYDSALAKGVSESTNINLSDFQEFKFDTQGLQLESGKKYMAFLSVLNFLDGQADGTAVGITTDVYLEGGAYFANDGGSQSFNNLFNASSWSPVANKDFAFKATFGQVTTSVPEPASIMGILGLGAVGLTSLRKRKPASTVKA